MSSRPVPTALFTGVERETTLSVRATAGIEELIVGGRFKPGDRLPSERQLANQLGVSRTVVREAIRSLVARDLVEVKAGRGTVVLPPKVETVTRPLMRLLQSGHAVTDCAKIHEIRTLLETEIAGVAACRRTNSDLEEMSRILASNSTVERDRNGFAEGDVAFHNALARATDNELFSVLLNSVVDIMLVVRQLAFDLPNTPARAHGHHVAIYEKVKAGDGTGARDAMRSHLDEAWASIDAVLKRINAASRR